MSRDIKLPPLPDLDFHIEDVGDVRVLVWIEGGRRPATDPECALWDALMSGQPAASADTEHAYAFKEAARNAASDDYSAARAWVLNVVELRKIFEAGFDRGWDARAAKDQPCNHIFEAHPSDGSWSASVSSEPVCAKCGYRPAVNATKGAQR